MKEISFTRTWTPMDSTNQNEEPKHYTSSLLIYENGDSQGFLLDQDWVLYKFQSRGYNQDGCIYETGLLDAHIPLHPFSIESYPASYTRTPTSYLIWIPGWKIQVSLNAKDLPVQTQSHPRVSSLVGPSHPPGQHRTSQQHLKPSPLRQQQQTRPASPAPEKLHYSRPKPLQQNERNKRNTLPTSTSSPSSNPTSLLQQPTPNPKKPVSHHPRSASKKPFQPHPKQSSTPGKSTSVSADQTNSG